MLIQTNGDSISYRIISHNSRTPIVAQATTAKKITESHLDTSHIPVKSAGALLHAWGKAQTAALAVGSQKKKKKTFGPSAYAEETTWVEAQRSVMDKSVYLVFVGLHKRRCSCCSTLCFAAPRGQQGQHLDYLSVGI